MSKKIVGNPVGIPNPITDLAQKDPTKADYVKNKKLSFMEDDVGYATKEYVDEEIKRVYDYATNISSSVDNRLTDEMFLMEERIDGRLALKADKSDIGDIETALDNIIAEQEAIIAIQNSLIGGDSV